MIKKTLCRTFLGLAALMMLSGCETGNTISLDKLPVEVQAALVQARVSGERVGAILDALDMVTAQCLREERIDPAYSRDAYLLRRELARQGAALEVVVGKTPSEGKWQGFYDAMHDWEIITREMIHLVDQYLAKEQGRKIRRQLVSR